MKGERFHNDGLSLICEKKLSHLKSDKGGFHCSDCCKQIIDFRSKTKQEYDQILNSDKTVCGVFNAEQIGFDKGNSWNKLIFAFSLVGTIFLSSELKAQNNQQVDSLNFVNKSSSDSLKMHSDTLIRKETGETKRMSKKDVIEHSYKKKRKLYVNRRFPFIHYDRKYIPWIGTPSNFW